MVTHVIQTDLESDDAMFIVAHNKQYSHVDVIFIIGESEKPQNKLLMLETLISSLPLTYSHVTYYIGFPSAKKYPLSCQRDLEMARFTQIQLTSVEAYDNVVALADVIFMIKPPREAILSIVEHPHTTVYAYGSFNWRALKISNADEFTAMAKRYEKFYYYDTFTAIGEQNSAMLPIGGHRLYEDTYYLVKMVIRAWNTHILEEMKSKPQSDRGDKIIKAVEDHVDEQYVTADLLLMLVDPPLQTAKLISVAPYPVWEADPDGPFHVYLDDAKEKRLKQLETHTAVLFHVEEQ